MKLWQVSVVGVAIFTLFILVCLSFDSLEYVELGLNYSWISENVENRTYQAGRYYLGLGNHFIAFPKTVQSIFFVDSYSAETDQIHGPPLESRTHDGLTIQLEVSFQYKLKPNELYDLYSQLGPNYEPTIVRMAIEELSTATTRHNASDFFQRRTRISEEMEKHLDARLSQFAFCEVPFFQLRTVHLPKAFEDSIQLTQVKRQDIQIARWEQASSNVTFEKRVMQATQNIRVLQTQALAEATAILTENRAYCSQYNITQELMAEALLGVERAAGWTPQDIIDYLRIRAVRGHPSERTVIRL